MKTDPQPSIDVHAILAASQDIDYSRLPEHVRPSMRRYIEDGLEPGHSLMRVLEGRIDAVLIFRSDLPALHAIVRWLHDDVPSACWGGPDQVQHWIASRRRTRQERA
jgi:hypothetical protein